MGPTLVSQTRKSAANLLLALLGASTHWVFVDLIGGGVPVTELGSDHLIPVESQSLPLTDTSLFFISATVHTSDLNI